MVLKLKSRPIVHPLTFTCPLMSLACHSVTEGLMSQLQSVQNAAAHMASGTQHYDRITPVLQELHWLPVWSRVDFKITTLVYLSLPIWPPTVSWSPTKVVVSCVLPHQGRVLSDWPTATMEMGVMQRQVRNSGSVSKHSLNAGKFTRPFNQLIPFIPLFLSHTSH